MTQFCARCRRPIAKVIVVEGRGYGSACSKKVRPIDLLAPPAQEQAVRHRGRRKDERQGALVA